MNLENRYDFVLLFDVKDGNPNGDPDAGNMPRIDAETGRGLVTDVCLKRKVRNYVSLVKGNEPHFGIYVKERTYMNETHARAYSESEELLDAIQTLREAEKTEKPKKGKNDTNQQKEEYEKAQKAYKEAQIVKRTIFLEDLAQKWVVENFFDVRTFGAVMSTSDKDEESNLAKKAGQVRGPIQLTFSRSIHPIVPSEHTITVSAARKTDKEYGSQVGIQGRKFTIPYGLYRCHGFISAHLAQQTGFSEEDLELFFTALEQMFEHDRSAARGEMTTRGLYVFKHESLLGNAHANKLFERIKVTLENGDKPPRDFADYSVMVDESNMPAEVKLIQRIQG